MQVHSNFSLAQFHTFGIDVKCSYFVEVTSIEELKSILSDESWSQVPKLYLGGGSNVLFLNDFKGLVIKIGLKGVEKIEETEEYVFVRAQAGEVWHDFVEFSIQQNWAGIENLSLIPGTVGAAPMQNIGAYGVEVKDVVETVEALEIASGNLRVFTNAECEFGYRESIFKRAEKGKYVITAVTFKMCKVPALKLAYGDIQKQLLIHQVTDEVSIADVSKAVVAIRKSKLPDPKEIGNAGSFFKNPEISFEEFDILKANHPTVPGYIQTTNVKVPAGWLIEQAGWKGYKLGNVGVHDKQALVLVNLGGGAGTEIKELALKIQKSVLEKYNVLITPEVNFIEG